MIPMVIELALVADLPDPAFEWLAEAWEVWLMEGDEGLARFLQ